MIVIGALGFAKELLEVLAENNIEDFLFFDNVTSDPDGCIFKNFNVVRDLAHCAKHFATDHRFVLGVGNVQTRHKLFKEFTDLGGELAGVASLRSSIGSFNRIDPTCTIMQHVIIENDNTIGRGVLLHVGAFVSHDVVIDDFCEISPFSKLLGGCQIGSFCSIGTGAIILPRIKIGSQVTVGAGAVVTKDIPDGLTVVGIPAKNING